MPINVERKRLEENNAAADLELTRQDLAEIDATAAKITILGARYPEALQAAVNK